MRIFGLLTAGWLVLGGIACAQNSSTPAGGTAPAATEGAASVGSYGIGWNISQSLKSAGLELDLESFIQGLRDGLKGAKLKYSNEQLQMGVDFLQRDAQAKREKINQSLGDKNLREGSDFLKANKARKEVVTMPSGLQYEVLKSGKGASPRASDTVRVHYEGTLIDGTVFDSSIKRKEPAEFRVGGVIPGWIEALQLMKVGDHWKLFIPAGLAYGSRGAGDSIGPNSVLVFDVELLDIVSKPDKK